MYTEYYSFAKKPFQLTPDPDFFFNSPVHKRALSYLRYGLTQGEGFIVVTGMPGTGKTMLVKALFQALEDESIVAGLMVTSQVGAEDTLRIISATFGLSYDGDEKATLLRNLEYFFKEKAREGKRVLLVVDEAQHLPLQSLEELRMLSNYEINGRPLFQAFLLGQDEFRLSLQTDHMAQVRQRVIATYHLRPLTVEETQDYILHRLKLAGWRRDPSFTDGTFAKIHEFTEGVPRIINTVCDRLLLFAYLEELHQIDESVVQSVLDEIQEEIPDAADLQEAMMTKEAESPVFSGLQSQMAAKASPQLLERLDSLERGITGLRKVLQKERVLLRKAILLQLDMDAVYALDEDELARASANQRDVEKTQTESGKKDVN